MGPQILNPDSQGVVKTMANVNLSIHLSTVGGATSVVLNTVNATNPNSNISTFILLVARKWPLERRFEALRNQVIIY